MNTMRKVALLSGIALAALGSPALARDDAASQAATSDDPATAAKTAALNDEIIVTAQRRAEKVTDVPISITVASAAQLERQQVNTVSDLARIAPSLEIQSAPGQNTGGGGSIRGIGTMTFSPGAVASVGVVVDQVSQGNANISDLFDVARIEVLKGPQGTLFGLTTSAGVINITTNKPDFTGFSARVRTQLSGAGIAGSKFGNQVVQGMINVPLSNNAGLRFSGVSNLRQGVDRNALTGDLNDTDHYSLRGRFLWEPNSRVTVNVIGDYSHSRYNNGGDFFTFVQADPTITSELASCGVTVGEGNRDYCMSDTFHATSKNYGGSVQVDYEADPFTLTSITALRKSRDSGYGSASDVFRADSLPINVRNDPTYRNIQLFTQEFRVSSPATAPIEYTVGAFYSNQKQTRQLEAVTVRYYGYTVAQSATPAMTIRDESLAFFGQLTGHVTDSFRLIGGVRYTTDRLSLDTYDTGGGVDGRIAHDAAEWSWRLGAQYDLNPNTMAYTTVSRGFKGGQIAVPSDGRSPYVVLPEVPTSYEVGLKTTLFDGLVADASLFYMKIDNFQAQSCTVNSSSVISCDQKNVNGVKTRGAELNFYGKVSSNLSLSTGFIYAKATYPGGYTGTDGTDIGGTQLAYSPRYKFTFSGEYQHEVGRSLDAFLSADAVWKSRIRYEENSLENTTFRPHWIVGGRLGLRTKDERYSVALFVRNLFNVHEPALLQSSFPMGDTNVGAIYGPQSYRNVGISLDASF